MSVTMRVLCNGFALLLLVSAVGAQTTWHVDAASAGAGTGSAAAPFSSIQDGIAAAGPGDTVLVHPGAYGEQIDFLGKAITLISTHGPEQTAIFGGLARTVVLFRSGEGPASVLEGFTIRYGRGESAGLPGGLWIQNSSPLVRDCIIRNNQGRAGDLSGVWGNPVAGSVAGMRIDSGLPTFIRCRFTDNLGGAGVSGDPGSMGGTGGVSVEGGTTLFAQCHFVGNRGGHGGNGGYNSCGGNPGGAGALRVLSGATAVLYDCLIADNLGGNGGDEGYPNCVLGPGGAGAIASGGTVALSGCTVVSNVSGTPGNGLSPGLNDYPGAISANSGSVRNSIVYFNQPVEFPSAVTAESSCIEGLTPLGTNIASDPLFVDPMNGDFHLSADSPCIDAGNNAWVIPTELDLDGDPRIFHGQTDMGADETILSLQATQPGGPGAPFTLRSWNLTSSSEYFNLFSLELCPNGPGTGSPLFGGLCFSDPANLVFLADQLTAPIDLTPFHFTATGSSMTWGPMTLGGPLIVEALCVEWTGSGPGSISRVERIQID